MSTVIASTDVLVYEIDKDDLAPILKKHATFQAQLEQAAKDQIEKIKEQKKVARKKRESTPKPEKKFHQAVVIPSYGELEMLPQTLHSLNLNNITRLKDTLVIIIINQDLFDISKIIGVGLLIVVLMRYSRGLATYLHNNINFFGQ